jgi:limonene-1,2-epoxide hydrolase
VWWNSARGAIVCLEPCLDGIEQLYGLLEVAYVDVPVRNVLAERGRVVVERSDNLFRKDGSVVAYVPVTSWMTGVSSRSSIARRKSSSTPTARTCPRR